MLALFFEGGPAFGIPSGDSYFITLACSQEWFLWTPPDLLKDATDMSRLIAYAELVLDQSGYAATGPHRTAKAKGFGTQCQQLYELGTLTCRKQRWSARSRLGTKGLRASKRRPFQPVADSSLRDAQSFGYVQLGPSFEVQCPGALASAFVPITRLVVMWCAHSHSPSITHTCPKLISYLCPDL